MKILFIHQNMPGQYKHLCRAYGADPTNTVVFVTKPKKDVDIPGVHKVEFHLPRDPSQSTHRYLIPFERAVIEGQEVWRICKKLKHEEGFEPDVIVAHPGWGDTLFIKDIYPKVPLLCFFEFYYRSHGADVNFDSSDSIKADDEARIRIKNATNLFSLESADWGVSPTHWQFIQHPPEFRHKISIIHDGVDTDAIIPVDEYTLTLPTGRKLTRSDEVVTYVARNFEPYRGIQTFMRGAKEILTRRPNCHILAVGGDGVSYGKKPAGNKSWRQLMLEEVRLTQEQEKRLHWFGWQQYDDFLKILKISQAHIYLTYPFVLSWSMIEAMSAGCLVIGSRTAPVEEVIKDGENGLLTDFFDHKMLADKVDAVFNHPDRMAKLRQNARITAVEKYSLQKLMPLQISLINDMAKGLIPPPTATTIANLSAGR